MEAEEKRMLVTQLQEKSSEVSRLEKRMADLQKAAEGSSSLEKDEKQVKTPWEGCGQDKKAPCCFCLSLSLNV